MPSHEVSLTLSASSFLPSSPWIQQYAQTHVPSSPSIAIHTNQQRKTTIHSSCHLETIVTVQVTFFKNMSRSSRISETLRYDFEWGTVRPTAREQGHVITYFQAHVLFCLFGFFLFFFFCLFFGGDPNKRILLTQVLTILKQKVFMWINFCEAPMFLLLCRFERYI